VKTGTYIRHFLYRNRGKAIYRYGIVLKYESGRPVGSIEVLWYPILINKEYRKNQQSTYVEIIKMELIEIISEPC
jgi:hypothetical protein